MPLRNRNGKLEWRFKVAGHEYSHITDLADTQRNRITAQTGPGQLVAIGQRSSQNGEARRVLNMPIRPDLRPFYRGPAWRAARERIRTRAKDRCEQCGKPNGETVETITGAGAMFWRSVGGPWRDQAGRRAAWSAFSPGPFASSSPSRTSTILQAMTGTRT